MLAIDRTPLYRNKFLLSSLAVVAGFVITVGAIRVIDPADTTPNQSTQTTSDDRASLLTPIKSSSSESAPESDKDKTSSTDQTDKSTTSSTESSTSTRTTPSNSPMTTQATTPEQKPSSKTPPAEESETTAPTSDPALSCPHLNIAGGLICY